MVPQGLQRKPQEVYRIGLRDTVSLKMACELEKQGLVTITYVGTIKKYEDQPPLVPQEWMKYIVAPTAKGLEVLDRE